MTDTHKGLPREADGRLKRPCIEEFVAAGYKKELYDEFFGENYGPGWSNPKWVAANTSYEDERDLSALVEGLPTELHVRSQVRRLGTRTVRATQPTRHRFKNYLFSDPSRRLLRGRPVKITSTELVSNLDDFLDKERIGMLSVHALDGRRIDLALLKAGIPKLEDAPVPAPVYNRQLDSIANDTPAGEALPNYVDGTFEGDPAAERALERLVVEKEAEAERQGVDVPEVPVIIPPDVSNPPAAPSAPPLSRDPAAGRSGKRRR